MLWHAIGIKAFGVLDAGFNSVRLKTLLSETRYYDVVISSSSIDRYYTAACQGVDVRVVHVTGTPRTDCYMEKRAAYVKAASAGSIRILYAPTFRDEGGVQSLFFPFSDFTPDRLASFFANWRGCKISLRPHPRDSVSISHAERLAALYPENIEALSVDVVDDIDAILHKFDVIVTDYSSIYMEPLIADVPPIFVAVDLDDYERARGVAYEYGAVTPGPKVNTMESLIDAIIDAMHGAPGWRQQRGFVRSIFFKYVDGGARERVLQLCLNK